MSEVRRIDPSNGDLTVRTGVAGRSARLGHRLVLAPRLWHGDIEVANEQPVALAVTVDAGSLEVVSGEGGLTPLTPPERGVAGANALKSLRVKRFATIEFRSRSISSTDTGYRIDGELTICGATEQCRLVVVRDGETFSTETTVRQTDFGIKPFSLMMGTLAVADQVTIAASAIP